MKCCTEKQKTKKTLQIQFYTSILLRVQLEIVTEILIIFNV